MRNLPAAVQHVKDGHWDRYPFQGRELFGKTVLILGYGRIGRQVHALYAAFGCDVIALDCIDDRVPMQLRFNTKDAFAKADILSIHVSLDISTKCLVDEFMLDRLKPGAWLVNTSRGEIVDQSAVIKRVADGRLAGAALDVLNDEPHPFYHKDLQSAINGCGSRLIITPHIAGFTHESLRIVENFATNLLLRKIEEN
jgi:phosphoglycerate dehydrogenase-like enzyme